MEINSTVVATGLVSLGYHAVWYLYKYLFERPLDQRKKLVLLIPSKCGKSQLCKTLQSRNKNLRLVDLDECVKASVFGNATEQLKLAWGEQHQDRGVSADIRRKFVLQAIEDVKREWLINKDRKAIFVTSDVDVALERFKRTSVCVAIPSKRYAEQIRKQLSDSDKRVFDHSREQFRQFEFGDDEYVTFDSIGQLASEVMVTYRSLKHAV